MRRYLGRLRSCGHGFFIARSSTATCPDSGLAPSSRKNFSYCGSPEPRATTQRPAPSTCPGDLRYKSKPFALQTAKRCRKITGGRCIIFVQSNECRTRAVCRPAAAHSSGGNWGGGPDTFRRRPLALVPHKPTPFQDAAPEPALSCRRVPARAHAHALQLFSNSRRIPGQFALTVVKKMSGVTTPPLRKVEKIKRHPFVHGEIFPGTNALRGWLEETTLVTRRYEWSALTPAGSAPGELW